MFPIVLFIASAVSLLVISITMLVRANDLRIRKGIVPNVRLVGFVLCGFTPFGIIGSELITHSWPTFYETMMRVGLMCVFVTTPYLPPWWKFIVGWHGSDVIHWTDDRRKPEDETNVRH